MNIWEEFVNSINDVKLGFIVAMVIGYSFYRLSKKSTDIVASKAPVDDLAITEDYDGDEYKMVLVIRMDLKMEKGKIAAQCAHAAVCNYKTARKHPKILAGWENCGQAKITLKVNSVDELNDIAKTARELGLIVNIIRDAGRTQIPSGSLTVCGIGPAPADVIDQVTGHLKLY